MLPNTVNLRSPDAPDGDRKHIETRTAAVSGWLRLWIPTKEPEGAIIAINHTNCSSSKDTGAADVNLQLLQTKGSLCWLQRPRLFS